MIHASVKFLPAGDGALVVEFATIVDRAISDRVLALAHSIRGIAGIVETVPTFRSLLVQYDPLRTSARELETAIRDRLDQAAPSREPARRWRLPACYDAALAPDLAEVAQRTNLSVEKVVALHTSATYRVYVIGFAPGFGFLGDLAPELELPRRTDPRVRVPAGSVAIALRLTGIYVQESPGGWHLIAACPVRFFDCDAPEPSLFAQGDEVVFDPVKRDEYEAIKDAVARGAYRPPCEAPTP